MDIALTHTTLSARRSAVSGMTLIEILIGLAVAGIVLAFALPSFENSSRNSALRAATMDLVTALNSARAQAVVQRANVTVTAVAGDWNQGWIVQYPAAAVEEDSEFTPPGGVQMLEVGGINTVVFNQVGLPDAALDFNICDGRANETGRRVTVSRAGRVVTEDLSPCF